MSETTEEKTEQPTEKKLKDSLEEGQSFKFKELIYVVNFLSVIACLYFINIKSLIDLTLTSDLNLNFLKAYFENAKYEIFLAFFLPIIMSIVSVLISSMFQTKFTLAFKSLKFDVSKLNPISGFKNIFSVKTIIELIKSIVVHIVGVSFVVFYFFSLGPDIFRSIFLKKSEIISYLFDSIVIFAILAMLIIFLFVLPFAYFEYRNFISDLKMTKQEVKREQKEQNGSPEIKGKRMELHRELLSEQDISDIKRSSVILANPTHIAIGVYFNQEHSPIPFVSIKCIENKAKQVFEVAKLNQIPIIRNKDLTRAVYAKNERYSLIIDDSLIKVLYLLHWLENIEYKKEYYDEYDVGVWW